MRACLVCSFAAVGIDARELDVLTQPGLAPHTCGADAPIYIPQTITHPPKDAGAAPGKWIGAHTGATRIPRLVRALCRRPVQTPAIGPAQHLQPQAAGDQQTERGGQWRQAHAGETHHRA